MQIKSLLKFMLNQNILYGKFLSIKTHLRKDLIIHNQFKQVFKLVKQRNLVAELQRMFNK